MIDDHQIQAWVQRHLTDARDRIQIALALQRLRNQDQVRECQGYVLTLVNGQRSRSTILEFIRSAQRIALQRPQGRLVDITPQEALAWNNTKRYPHAMPRPDQPWPKENEARWRVVTHESRQESQDALIRFYRYAYQTAGMTPSQANERAQALIAPPVGLDPLPRAHRQQRPDPRPEDWNKLLAALEERHYPLEAIRDMWRFVIRVMMTQGNRLPALTRAPLSSLKLQLQSGRGHIDKIRGPRNKPNPTLHLDAEALAAGAVWMQSHPFRDHPDPPLLIAPKAALQGVCRPIYPSAIVRFLNQLGQRAALPFPMGSRAFRYYGHDQGATAGLSAHHLNLKFGRSPSSNESRHYVRFSEWRVVELMRRIRGLPDDSEQRCPGCRRLLNADQPACTSPGCPRAGQAPVTNNTELLADLGITLHRHEANPAKA